MELCGNEEVPYGIIELSEEQLRKILNGESQLFYNAGGSGTDITIRIRKQAKIGQGFTSKAIQGVFEQQIKSDSEGKYLWKNK